MQNTSSQVFETAASQEASIVKTQVKETLIRNSSEPENKTSSTEPDTTVKPSQMKGAFKATDSKLNSFAVRPNSIASVSTTFRPATIESSESSPSVDSVSRPSSMFAGGSESTNVKPSQMKSIYGEQSTGNVKPSALKATDSKFGKK